MNWHSGWSQPTFFEIDGAFIMPRPKVSSVEMTLTRRIDWLLAGRLMRLFDQSDASAAENWVLNFLFVGSEPMSVLWYDGSTDPMDVVTRGCDVLRKAGHQSICFVSDLPLSHLQARRSELEAFAVSQGIKTLNVWAT